MTYRSNYVPKKRKVNYKLVVLFSLLVALVIGYFVFQNMQKPTVVNTDYTMCGLTSEASYAKVNDNKSENTVNMADHSFYGQSLAMFKDPYSIHNVDGFSGRTVFVKNLCTGSEQVFLLGLSLDETIPLQQLEEGFYQIQVMDGFNRAQVVSETSLDESFATATRNGVHNDVRLIANANMFEKNDIQILDANYVYLEVKQAEAKSDVVDIVLDPNGLYESVWGGTEYGVQTGDFVESDEMYRLAEAVKSELVSRGYRVTVIRDNETLMNVNGSNGRLARSYSAEAKYYVHFKVYESNVAYDTGAYILHSNTSSHRFANAIMKEIMNKTDLEVYVDDEAVPGVVVTDSVDGMDNNDVIREAGGRMTYAGMYDVFAELNDFAKDSNRGMEALVVVLGNISDSATQAVWNNQFDQIVVAIADGISYELGSE